MNTRKFPRTMNEAFPHTADYACSVEAPYHRSDKIVIVASVVCLFCFVAIGVL